MSEMTMKVLASFAMFSLTGWILLLVGFGARRERRRREDREHTRVEGRVADYVPGKKPGLAPDLARPVIEFTADGQPYRLEYPDPLSRQAYPVGEPVEVLYDVSDPTRFHLEADEAFYKGGGRLVRIGGLWIAASLALTLALAVFVGGASLDLNVLWHNVVRLAHGQPVSHPEPETGEAYGFRYQLRSDSTAVLVDYDGLDLRLLIPAVVDGYIVTGLSGAPLARNTDLQELTVPGTIDTIPMMSFVACVNLSRVTLWEGVRSIGSHAFELCLSLREVKLPASLTSIADDAFPEGCAARFTVVEGSEAERYCRQKGFTVEIAAKD